MPSVKKKLALKSSTAAPSKVFQCPERVSGRVMLSYKQTAAKLGIHELTIYRHLKNIPDFPRPIKLTEHRRAFFEDEVDRYLETRPRA